MAKYAFSFVTGPTGSISGESVLRQIEDAINALGSFAVDGSTALTVAEGAARTANAAANTAQQALTAINSTQATITELSTSVSTLTEAMPALQASVQTAAKQAASAAETAAQASERAGNAETAAGEAKTAAESAAQSAQSARQTAETAAGAAQSAQASAEAAATAAAQSAVDVAGIMADVTAAKESAAASAEGAKSSASEAKSAATDAAQSASTAYDWAEKIDGPVSEAIPATEEEEAIPAEYSAHWWANQAEAAITGTVRYNEAQTLTDEEQAQARANIGAAGDDAVPSGAVLYDQAQTLTDSQQKQARDNVNALAAQGNRWEAGGYQMGAAVFVSQDGSTPLEITETSPDQITIESTSGMASIAVAAGHANHVWTKTVCCRGVTSLSTSFGAGWHWPNGDTMPALMPQNGRCAFVLCWTGGTEGLIFFING